MASLPDGWVGVVRQNYRSDKYCLWEFCFPNRFLRLLVSQSFITNLDVFTLAIATFPYITSLDAFYDNRCQGSDIRKNRKIVIFLTLKVCVPVHVYDLKS